MLFKSSISPDLAQELFNDSEKALRFIADIKWEDGFVCRKCGNTNFCEGKSPSSRRCTRCKTEESATAHTLFHNCKFPINKAFYIAYTMCVEGKPLSSYCYADQLGLNQMTCWKFRKRIENCLSKREQKTEESSLQSILMNQD